MHTHTRSHTHSLKQGDPGARGGTGPQGERGAPGDNGPKGSRGGGGPPGPKVSYWDKAGGYIVKLVLIARI